MRQLMVLLIVVLFVCPAFAAGMVQIVGILDSNTLTVDERGSRSTVELGGVVVPISEEARAVEFLRRVIASGWALMERDPRNPAMVWLYRSPDGLSVNGEMIRAAWRQPGTPMIYLGEADPGPRPEVAPVRRKAAPRKAAAKPPSPRPRKLRR